MGQVPHTALRVVAVEHSNGVGNSGRYAGCDGTPGRSVQPHRGQYDAGLVLKSLARCSFPRHSRLLAITDVDLCTPIHTFVFGEAELGLSRAIVSDFRLKHGEDGIAAAEGTYYERLAKVALHELAHTFSLYHCETPKCLMQFSYGLSHLDELDIFFCERCTFMLRQSVGNLHP